MTKPCNVLIADDDRLVNWVVREWVAESGRTTYLVENAYQALGMLISKPDIGVLLTDIRMPIMDGNELIREALKIRPDLGVVVMTGFIDRVESPEKYPVMKKPFQPAELTEVLACVIDRGNPNYLS